MNHIGILLTNIGSPEKPDVKHVRSFLREFLIDPMVLDIHPVLRFLLVYGVILPLRPRKTAKAYQEVWTPEGSPLIVYSRRFMGELFSSLKGNQLRSFPLDPSLPVDPSLLKKLGMAYGRPSMKEGLDELVAQGCTTIVLFPLFPHEALATSDASVVAFNNLIKDVKQIKKVKIIPPFFNDLGYLNALIELIKESWHEGHWDHLIFSFHGLPMRHLEKKGCAHTKTCSKPLPCENLTESNLHCYRAQCFYTVRAVVDALGIGADQYSVGFQSRFGSDQWTQPNTSEVVKDLASRGMKRVLVACPSFVADCLETLEEIGIREKKNFLKHGGEVLELVPCLNSSPAWVKAAEELVMKELADV